VGPRREPELRQFALIPDDGVVRLVRAHRHAGIGHIRHLEQSLVQTLLHRHEGLLNLLDALADRAHLLNQRLARSSIRHVGDLF